MQGLQEDTQEQGGQGGAHLPDEGRTPEGGEVRDPDGKGKAGQGAFPDRRIYRYANIRRDGSQHVQRVARDDNVCGEEDGDGGHSAVSEEGPRPHSLCEGERLRDVADDVQQGAEDRLHEVRRELDGQDTPRRGDAGGAEVEVREQPHGENIVRHEPCERRSPAHTAGGDDGAHLDPDD